MTHYQQLLGAWNSRSVATAESRFSTQARQRIVALFLEVAIPSVAGAMEGGNHASLSTWSTELAKLAIDDGLSASVFCAELRNCQLSLVDILITAAIDTENQRKVPSQQAGLPCVATVLASLDGLISQSSAKLGELECLPKDSVTSPDNNGKKKKTLQHEIRTPLQGALLTTELMLEDARHGDPVSAEDILAVRKSIETAVRILNDFASRSSSDGPE